MEPNEGWRRSHPKTRQGLKPGEIKELIKEHLHDDRPRNDKRAWAQVSFGQWDADPAGPFDRQPINTDTENRTAMFTPCCPSKLRSTRAER